MSPAQGGLDHFERVAALERPGHLGFDPIEFLPGRTLIDRWRCGNPQLGSHQEESAVGGQEE